MPDNAPTNANNRVTLAVLGTNQEHMIGLLEQHHDEYVELEKRVRASELAIVDHSVQLRIRTAALTGLNVILSAAAAFIGRL